MSILLYTKILNHHVSVEPEILHFKQLIPIPVWQGFCHKPVCLQRVCLGERKISRMKFCWRMIYTGSTVGDSSVHRDIKGSGKITLVNFV